MILVILNIVAGTLKLFNNLIRRPIIFIREKYSKIKSKRESHYYIIKASFKEEIKLISGKIGISFFYLLLSYMYV